MQCNKQSNNLLLYLASILNFCIQIPGTDLIIQKNTAIYFSLNSTGQDPRYFPDPQKFDPLRKPTEDKKFFEYLAFGIGPRACLGEL